MQENNIHRKEILTLLRKADCHYGAALRDEEAGLSIDQAATKRDRVRTDRIVDLRKAVHMVADGDYSINKKQASHEEAVLRALLHFDGEMSRGLHQHIVSRLAEVQPQFGMQRTVAPLRCVTRGANARRH